MATMSDIVRMGRAVEAHRPGPRVVVDANGWRALIDLLGEGRGALFALWGEPAAVSMAVLDDADGVAVFTLECPDGRFLSVARDHLPAMRLERTIFDLFGLRPVGVPDGRPWLDHGAWAIRRPLGVHHQTPRASDCYVFLRSEGDSLHQIPVGPVHAGIIEPGHFRFTASGETVVRLEERLGYVHKGIESLMAGASIERAARLAGRTSGDSTVAYALAFAHAIEAAFGIEPPRRAAWLRALMAELERIANHLGDIGAVCNDASFIVIHAECGVLRERVLRAADSCFGHRLMMDCVVPGGVAVAFDKNCAAAVRDLVGDIRRRFPALIELYDNTASLQDRTVGTGVLAPALAKQFGCGGFIGRASGRSFDARRNLAYSPYDELQFDAPVLQEGDVNARVWIRIREVEQSLALIDQLLAGLPDGEERVEISNSGGEEAREGFGVIEGFRGDIFVWMRVDAEGKIERCHLRDPSWFQWPLLEAVIEGNIVADFPLCNKSFNCSYSGHDL